jgi:O-antigen ligase
MLLMLGFLLLQMLTYAMGMLEVGDAVVESSKTRTLLITIADAGLALYIIQSIRTPKQRSIALGCLVTGLAFACTVGVLQGLTPFDFRFALVPPGVVTNLDAAGLDPRGSTIRVLGTSDHAIEFAVIAAITVPLSLHCARFASTPIRRQLSVIASIIGFMAVPLAVSRTGVVALVAALLVYAFSMRLRLLGNAAIIGAAILLLYKIVHPGPLNSLIATITGSGSDSSVLGRTEDYAAVEKQFRDDPVFGLGLGAYPPTEFRFLDNQWLQAVVQGGLVGVAAMVILVGGGIAGMVSGLRKTTDAAQRDQMYALGAAYAGVQASSLTFDLFTFQQASLIGFLLFGLCWCARPPTADQFAEIRSSAAVQT